MFPMFCHVLGSVSSKEKQYLHSVMLAVIGGWGSHGSLKSVEAFSICNNTWSSLCEMPDSRSGCGAAVVGGKVYVVGGMDRNRDSMSSVYIVQIAQEGELLRVGHCQSMFELLLQAADFIYWIQTDTNDFIMCRRVQKVH